MLEYPYLLLSEALAPGNTYLHTALRIGFAFHHDPSQATGRFPSGEQNFVSDLSQLDAWINSAENPAGIGVRPRYVMWDVVFDLAHRPGISQPPSLAPSTPRPELHELRLPFRF